MYESRTETPLHSQKFVGRLLIHVGGSVQKLPRIENTGRIKGEFYAPMERIGFGGDSDVPPRFFGQTHPVLTRDATSQRDDTLKQLIEGPVARLALCWNRFIEHQVHMNIPVSGMPEAGHLNAVLFLE